MGFVANAHGYWRGSIVYTFKFVKTQFHTGRLQVTFTPNYSNFTSPTLATGTLAMREIIDLRYSDEITLKLPWMVEFNYLTPTDVIGKLDILVLNELRCPETANSAIDILCFINGAEDFEYALPRNTSLTEGVSYIYPYYPQVNTMGECSIGGCCTMQENNIASAQSMGEKFTSLKQILNRATLIPSNNSTIWDNGFYIWPWICNMATMNSAGVTKTVTAGGDAYNFIAPMYAFYRGGVNIHISAANSYGTSMGSAMTSIDAWIRFCCSIFCYVGH